LTTQKVNELKNIMSKEFSAVFDLCLFIFENSQNVKQSLLIEAVKLFAENVKWFPLEYVFRDDILTRFLNDIKNIPIIRVQVMKCLGEICNNKFFNIISSWTTIGYSKTWT
jgi:exportin-1